MGSCSSCRRHHQKDEHQKDEHHEYPRFEIPEGAERMPSIPDLSFRTWELLYHKEVSRVVDEVIVDKQHDKNDVVKRLVRSFLPRFPDECRLEYMTGIATVEWDAKREDDDDQTHRITVTGDFREIFDRPSPCGPHGEAWVTYYDRRDEDQCQESLFEFKDGSKAGIARVVLLEHHECPEHGYHLVVQIRDVILFEIFFEYFDFSGYIGENLYDNKLERYYVKRTADDVEEVEIRLRFLPENYGGGFLPHIEEEPFRTEVWRSSDKATIGIDQYLRGYRRYIRNIIYRQLNGTWVYAYRSENICNFGPDMDVGLSLMTEERVEEIIRTFSNEVIEKHGSYRLTDWIGYDEESAMRAMQADIVW